MPFLTSAPTGYGLQPVHSVSGGAYTGGRVAYTQAGTTAASAFAKGQIIAVDASGVLTAVAGTTGVTILGVCDGVEYIDSYGALVEATGIASGVTVGTDSLKIFVLTDPNVVYKAFYTGTSTDVIASTGVSPAVGARTSLNVATAGSGVYLRGAGVASTVGTTTSLLVVLGVDPQSITEAKQTAPTGTTFYPEILVKVATSAMPTGTAAAI